MVVQGDLLTADASTALDNLLPGEGAVVIDVDVVMGALDRYRRERGR